MMSQSHHQTIKVDVDRSQWILFKFLQILFNLALVQSVIYIKLDICILFGMN